MSYAYIDEVWGCHDSKPKKSKKMDPSCALYKKRYNKDQPLDDIMNSYIDESVYSKYSHANKNMDTREEKDVNVDMDSNFRSFDVTDREKCMKPDPASIEGYREPMLYYSYEFDDYYKNQAKMPMAVPNENCEEESTELTQQLLPTTQSEEEHQEYQLETKDKYKDIILEKYMNHMTNEHIDSRSYYFDLVLYVFSGILLIFLMEQLLQLGKHIK